LRTYISPQAYKKLNFCWKSFGKLRRKPLTACIARSRAFDTINTLFR
jgi:hypothetical protein